MKFLFLVKYKDIKLLGLFIGNFEQNWVPLSYVFFLGFLALSSIFPQQAALIYAKIYWWWDFCIAFWRHRLVFGKNESLFFLVSKYMLIIRNKTLGHEATYISSERWRCQNGRSSYYCYYKRWTKFLTYPTVFIPEH